MNDHTTSATKYNAPDFPPGGREVLTCMAFIDAQPRTKKMHRISGLMKDVIRSWSGCFSIQSEHMHEAAQRLQAAGIKYKRGRVNIDQSKWLEPDRHCLRIRGVDIDATNLEQLQRYANRLKGGGQ